MKGISIIVPMEKNRMNLFKNTIKAYVDKEYEDVEFILVSRTLTTEDLKEIYNTLPYNVYIQLVPYIWDSPHFSQALALNIGIRNASYDSMIVTSPECSPRTNVLSQLTPLVGKNIVCQVFDTNQQGEITMSLVNSDFRSHSPAMHFLAMFNKADLELINGWSLDYIKGGGAYDDDDFGDRFNKAGLKFEIHDEIQAIHQYHMRGRVNREWLENQATFAKQQASNNWYAKNGLRETNEHINTINGK